MSHIFIFSHIWYICCWHCHIFHHCHLFGCEYLTWWLALAGPLPDVKLNQGSANVETDQLRQFLPQMGQCGEPQQWDTAV